MLTLGVKLLASFLRRFRTSEDGGPTVEFVLVFTPFIMLPVAGFELGLLMTRHAMMERGLDMAIREVRLNTSITVTEDVLKRLICNAAGVLPDCTTNVRLEMRPIDLFHTGDDEDNSIPAEASCTDVNNPTEPSREFTAGVSNEMMVVRACGIFSPMLPTFGLGYFLSNFTDGRYRLVSTSAFVMEPA